MRIKITSIALVFILGVLTTACDNQKKVDVNAMTMEQIKALTPEQLKSLTPQEREQVEWKKATALSGSNYGINNKPLPR